MKRIPPGFHGRLTLVAVAAGLVALLALVIAHPDHIEAWYFQLTRPTDAITPHMSSTRSPPPFSAGERLQRLADDSGHTVRIDSEEKRGLDEYVFFMPSTHNEDRTPADAVRQLQWLGWRVEEQRFPSRAYVLLPGVGPTIRDRKLGSTQEELLDSIDHRQDSIDLRLAE